MKKRFIAVPAVAVLLLAGCKDLRDAPVPTAIEDEALHSAAVVEESAASVERSTVCIAYDKQLDRAEDELAENTGRTALQEKVTSLQAIIADTCN